MGKIYLQSGLALAFNPLLMLIPVHSKNSEYRAFLSTENLAETGTLFFIHTGYPSPSTVSRI